MMKKWYIWLLIILILATGIYLGKDYLNQIINPGSKSGISAEEIDLAAAVTVSRGSIRETVSTSGYIQPENQVSERVIHSSLYKLDKTCLSHSSYLTETLL